MKKHVILLATVAVGAAAAAFVPAAEAGGRHHGFHFRFHNIWTPSFDSDDDDDEPRYRRPVVRRKVIKKVYVEREHDQKKHKKETIVSAKTSDGKGRRYDPAAKVWFDGESRCWSGKEAFSFKSGVWFYGGARWYELNGTWKTNAAEAPATIDCEASPMIARLQGKSKPKVAASAKDVETAAKPAKKKTAEAVKVAADQAVKPAEAPKATECKKYFPSVGEMLTVPCGQ